MLVEIRKVTKDSDMISRFELENFTVFSNLDVDFSPKINVIIDGGDGTGKINLLKAAYGICEADTLLRNGHGKAPLNLLIMLPGSL